MHEVKKKLHIEYEDPCKFGKNYEVTGPGGPNAMAFSFVLLIPSFS